MQQTLISVRQNCSTTYGDQRTENMITYHYETRFARDASTFSDIERINHMNQVKKTFIVVNNYMNFSIIKKIYNDSYKIFPCNNDSLIVERMEYFNINILIIDSA